MAAAFPDRYPLFLESAGRGPLGRYDLLLGWNGERLVGDCPGPEFAMALDQVAAALQVTEQADAPPFVGGWGLFFAYEYAQCVEPTLSLPRGGVGSWPVALALRCPAALVVDHLERRTWLVAEAGAEHWLETMLDDLQRAPPIAPCVLRAEGVVEDDPALFLQGVERVLEYIGAGDVFQVNLSRGWRVREVGSARAIDLQRALREANPGPFAALLQWRGEVLLSSSPERLIQVAGGSVQTRPIAGTRPRSLEPGADAALIAELVAHPKERAEHIMLIDLERNDLGRICVPGSVHVSELMAVESYRHVHHIVSNVRGRLRQGVSPSQAIHAVFPGGTISGCPKVRCMQIIAELEGQARGPYTGALGYLGRDGRMDLNILIRTLWSESGEIRFRAGCGIVADSNPAYELAESRAKARGLLRALGLP